MVLDHTKVVYTAEDEQGFTFRQINDEDAAVELRARRKKRNRWVLIAFVALLIGIRWFRLLFPSPSLWYRSCHGNAFPAVSFPAAA